MPLSNAGKNAIQAYGMKRFAFNPPATSTQVANQTTFNQDQAQSGPDKPAGPAPGTGVRARLLQTINPEPVRDTQEEGRLQQLAKLNALGTALGSLGQLAGVASGGDAVEIRNNLNPWIMDRMAYLDDDYRNQVRDYTTRAFAMDRFNIDQQNQDIQDQNNNEYQLALIQERAKKEKERLEEQLKNQLALFDRKSQEEKNKDYASVGIDPRDPKAHEKYVDRMNQLFGVNINYKKSLTDENNANAARTESGGSGNTDKPPFDLDTMKKGVQNIVSDLQKQKAQIKNLPFNEREAAQKRIDDEISFWERQYNPKTNELLNERVLDAANRDAGTQSGSGTFGEPFTPGRGFNFQQNQPQTPPQQRSEEEIMQAMNTNRATVIQNAKRIASINFENPDPETANLILEKAQELVDLGVFEDQDSAIESIIELAKTNAK